MSFEKFKKGKAMSDSEIEKLMKTPKFLDIMHLAAKVSREGRPDKPIELGGKTFTIDEVIENIEQDTEDGRMIVRILSERLKPSTLEQAVDKVFSELERVVRKLFGRE